MRLDHISYAATHDQLVDVVQSASNEILNVDLAEEITNYARTTSSRRTLEQIDLVLSARTNLSRNAAPLATLEALFCALK